MAGNLLSVWGTIGSVALAILILLAMITIHEFGHYIAGKILKFKIDEFSVGFGPALFKIKRKRSGELFAARLIPLGGYCAFHGEDGAEEEETPPTPPSPPGEGGEEDVSPSSESGQCSPAAANGNSSPAANDTPPPASEGGAGEEVRPEPATAEGARTELAEREENRPQSPPKKRDWDDNGSFPRMKPWKRIIVLVAGAAMNYLLALFLIIICFFAYGQTMAAVYEMAPSEEYDAAYSVHDFDILLQAEGKNLYLTTDIAQALNGKKKGDLVTLRVSRAIGFAWNEDETGAKHPTFDHREETDIKVMLREDVSIGNSAEIDGVWKALGVKYEAGDADGEGGYLLASAVYRFSFWETLGRAFVYSFKLAGSIFRVLGELLTGRLGLSAFGGPVTTITMTSQIVSQGFRQFLEISALIGVNLAVFNLLPIPALDGSKVVFTAIEWVRGRPISRKIEAIIHAAGFVLLIGFAILVDILQFV